MVLVEETLLQIKVLLEGLVQNMVEVVEVVLVLLDKKQT
jgi:hypothetical protein